MSVHRIALAGPWRCGDDAGRTTLPFDGGDRRDLVLHRRFGRPLRELDPGERAWLVIVGLSGQPSVSLNGEPLATPISPDGSLSCDITERLAENNLLEIAWSGEAVARLEGPVGLEFFSSQDE